MSYINSAFQNLFIRCHRVPKSISWWGIVGLDFTWLSRQASCHQSMPWPRGSDPLTYRKIHLAFHCRNLLAITWIPPLKKMDGFSVGGFLSVAISPHLKCQENQHAENQRNHKVHHIPTWHFAANATPMVCFEKTKRIWKLKSIR